MLTVREHMALQAEGMRWRYQGAKEAWVREHLGLTATRHAQLVMTLLERPEAEHAHPTLVRRLRRLREQRRTVRSARTIGWSDA